MTEHEISDMLTAYVECALWSSVATDLDGNDFFLDDVDLPLADDTEAEMLADCRAFFEANATDLADMEPAQAGHDFWLTRNGHGAGFWDRGLGALGDRLTAAADVYGSSDLYIGDDQRIHLA